MRRPRVLITAFVLIAAALVVGVTLPEHPTALGRGVPVATPTQTPVERAGAAPPTGKTGKKAQNSLFSAGPVDVDAGGYLGWAWLDRSTGEITTSGDPAATSTTASMIKPWLVSDYLRSAAEAGITPDDDTMHQLSIAIRDSDNDAATMAFRADGGTESLDRLIRTCGLTDSHPTPGEWSHTYVSPRDAVRMGECIADGRAAGPTWTAWVLNEMRHVRGESRFGIVDALPSAEATAVAIKNGYLVRDEDGLWHVSCLAIGGDWVLAVLMRYPAELGFAHGQNVCREVTAQLLG